jgi:hypothetical protein
MIYLPDISLARVIFAAAATFGFGITNVDLRSSRARRAMRRQYRSDCSSLRISF